MSSSSNYALPLAIGLGLIGGLAVAHMAARELFVVGLGDKERKNLLYLSGAAVFAGAAIYVLDIDRKWILADEAAKAIWERYAPP